MVNQIADGTANLSMKPKAEAKAKANTKGGNSGGTKLPKVAKPSAPSATDCAEDMRHISKVMRIEDRSELVKYGNNICPRCPCNAMYGDHVDDPKDVEILVPENGIFHQSTHCTQDS